MLCKRIPLVEALTGTKFTLRHLDGRRLVIKSAPGEVGPLPEGWRVP